MSKVEIYTKNRCSYCDKAKEYFNANKITFSEYNIFKNPKYLNEMLKRSNGYKTMPQIFINNNHIGGYNDLKKIIISGEIKHLIKFL